MNMGIRVKCFLAACLLFISFSSFSGINSLTGEHLLESCQALLIAFDNPKETSRDPIIIENRAICMGYIAGYEDMHFMATAIEAGLPRDYAEIMKKPLYYCIPENAGLRQVAMVVVKYLKEYPEDLNAPAMALVYAAFKKYFPCPKES